MLVSYTRQRAPELKERADDKKPMIVGYAAVYYDPANPGTEYKLWDGFVERMMPGAFDRAIREMDDVRALFNHDSSLLLARTKSSTLRLSVDATGLLYEIDAPESALGAQVTESVGRGDLDGSSFAFQIESEDMRKIDNVWIAEIKSVKPLYDVGPVTWPAYEATTSELRAARAKNAEMRIGRATRGRIVSTPRSVVMARARALEL